MSRYNKWMIRYILPKAGKLITYTCLIFGNLIYADESIESAYPQLIGGNKKTDKEYILSNAYIDSSYFTDIPFGTYSHWLQPWRAYMETVPAHKFLDAIGINLHLHGEDPKLIIRMLAKNGIKCVRIPVSWGSINYNNESLLNNSVTLRATLRACKTWDIRPLILLDAHHGVPCPVIFSNHTLLKDATRKARKLVIDNTSNLIVGYSGLSNLTKYMAAENIITNINGQEITLAKPMPVALPAGSKVLIATLKYKPFSKPNSDDNNRTIAGWKKYIGTVANFVSTELATENSIDKGFDMEIWNELTFGSDFLCINNYYDHDISAYNERSIWTNIIDATMSYVAANPAKFTGVKFSNGFANTIPWPASSRQPKRINAISKHPYPNQKNYPNDKPKKGITALNALGEKDNSFTPVYSVIFPEYFATALQTETIIRDMGPFTSEIYKTEHGRYARKDKPCPVWITEVGIAPNENGITNLMDALTLKAKTTSRFYTFFINKGVEKLTLFAASGGDLWLGLILDSFSDYAKTNSVYPENDMKYTSPALKVIHNIVNYMSIQIDYNLSDTRSLRLEYISDKHNHYQFVGDGTVEHPALYDREVFTFLPYEINKHRFVIAYYVMTRDITKALSPEKFTIKISGINGRNAFVEVYDPILNTTVPATINSYSTNSIGLTVIASDYPYLLTISEQ